MRKNKQKKLSDNNRMFTQIFFGATGKKMHMPMLSFLGEIFPTSFMLLIQALIKSTTTLITKMTLQVTFYKNSIFSKLSILYAFTLLKVSKFRKQIFQPKLLPKNEPTNLFFYTDYEPTIFFSILTTYQDRKTNTMVWFLEELLPGKFVFDFY